MEQGISQASLHTFSPLLSASCLFIFPFAPSLSSPTPFSCGISLPSSFAFTFFAFPTLLHAISISALLPLVFVFRESLLFSGSVSFPFGLPLCLSGFFPTAPRYIHMFWVTSASGLGACSLANWNHCPKPSAEARTFLSMFSGCNSPSTYLCSDCV